jgi:hypothetical protein
MVLEILTEVLRQAAQMNNVLAIGFLFVVILVVYRLFKVAMKAAMTGFLAALIPVAAFVLGINIGVPLSLNVMIWFSVLGISAYLAYGTLSTLFKVTKFITKPIGFLFGSRPQQKVIVQQVKTKKDEED